MSNIGDYSRIKNGFSCTVAMTSKTSTLARTRTHAKKALVRSLVYKLPQASLTSTTNFFVHRMKRRRSEQLPERKYPTRRISRRGRAASVSISAANASLPIPLRCSREHPPPERRCLTPAPRSLTSRERLVSTTKSHAERRPTSFYVRVAAHAESGAAFRTRSSSSNDVPDYVHTKNGWRRYSLGDNLCKKNINP